MTIETAVYAILGYLLTVVVTTASYVFIIVGPGLILALLMDGLTWFLKRQVGRIINPLLYLLLFGWLGIMVHELGHALFCILFMHTITDIKLLYLNAQDGTYGGYVKNEYDPRSVYQVLGTFFIGVAPIIVGSLVIYGAARYLLGPEVFDSMNLVTVDSSAFSSLGTFCELVKEIGSSIVSVISSIVTIENLTNCKFYVFLYVTFSIGSSITLSMADIKAASRGFVTFVILIFLVNLSTIWLTGRFADSFLVSLSQLYGSFYAIIIFALIMNLIFAVMLLPVWIFPR